MSTESRKPREEHGDACALPSPSGGSGPAVLGSDVAVPSAAAVPSDAPVPSDAAVPSGSASSLEPSPSVLSGVVLPPSPGAAWPDLLDSMSVAQMNDRQGELVDAVAAGF